MSTIGDVAAEMLAYLQVTRLKSWEIRKLPLSFRRFFSYAYLTIAAKRHSKRQRWNRRNFYVNFHLKGGLGDDFMNC